MEKKSTKKTHKDVQTKEKKPTDRNYVSCRIDKAQFERMCANLMSIVDISKALDVSLETIRVWCAQNYDGKTPTQAKELFASKTREGLLNAALNLSIDDKNPAMLMFMLKNNCGYADNPNGKVEKIDVSVTEHHNQKVDTINKMLDEPSTQRDISDFESEEKEE